MFTNETNKFWSLVMTGLADVDGYKICIKVCVWLGFPPLNIYVFRWIINYSIVINTMKQEKILN